MQKYRICSDLHLEILETYPSKALRIVENIMLPVMEGEDEQILIIAGDFCNDRQGAVLTPVMQSLSDRFQWVYYIPGNHEYYNDGTATCEQNILNRLQTVTGPVTFGETVNDFLANILGATLWTNYNGGSEDAMVEGMLRMNDYRKIKGLDGKLLTPNELLIKHTEHLKFLAQHMTTESIVFTHHAPSPKSMDPRFEGEPTNPCYFSDLDYLIKMKQPKLWIHGHTHCSMDYMIDNTRVICNPYGYHGYSDPLGNSKYNSRLVVEI